MFTGIITGVGHIIEITALGTTSMHGKQLMVSAPAGYLDDVALGDSIALNGACMTVTAMDKVQSHFCVDVSAESLARTVGIDRQGAINLEKALRANDRLDGHLVSGHVDGVGVVTQLEQVGESWQLTVLAPEALARYLAYKGSITVNGVSLTVNRAQDVSGGYQVSINLIPHTVQNTALHTLCQGDRVNLEIDLIARYVERMLSSTHTSE